MSAIFSLVGIPTWASGQRTPRLAGQALILGMVGFTVLYVLALRFLYHHLL